jgi:hypothetical protein
MIVDESTGGCSADEENEANGGRSLISLRVAFVMAMLRYMIEMGKE